MYLRAIAYNYHLYRKEFIAMFITVAGLLMLLLSLVLAPAANAINIGGSSDCDDNAVIRCGAHSTAVLISDYNSSAYVRGVYAAFGISQADISNLSSTNVAGRVTKDGNVFVDDQSRAVATGAVTGGRQDIPGSTKVNSNGAVFYRRQPSVSFQQSSLPAFVAMKNGHFQFAVIASCGNAVSAKQTTTPAPQQQHAAVGQARVVSRPQAQTNPPAPAPTAAPAPTQTQSQSQNQEVNVNNANINNNTQITKQTSVPQSTPAPTTAQPQAAAETPATQPATQTTAATLPNTGPTGIIGIFLAAVGLGTLGYRRLLVHRFSH
ncbi:MAG TPA: hypothetical protein VFH99_00885 [Candidatus Saccharimonadales bacterium]|nr:hypothetical protein [Candidatus Saccharimonadales bacterium]